MAQSVYCGISGSGKSYEVVRGVIVPSVANGRRVVTNVAGLKHDAIYAYCVNKLGCHPDNLGSVVQVQNEDIIKPHFFPIEKTPEALAKYSRVARIEEKRALNICIPDDVVDLMWDEQFVVQGGDVVVIDECMRFYGTGEAIPKDHITFFRMHRHFLHWQSGVSSDVVFISQAFSDLQRKVVANNDRCYVMQKHDDLGLPDRYVINIYSGSRQVKATHVQTLQDKYNPEIFQLYNSHSQKKAGIEVPRELKADVRGNVFASKLFRFAIPLAFMMMVAAVWYMWKFFHPEAKKPVDSPSAVSAVVPAAAPVSKPDKDLDGISKNYRLIGYILRDETINFLLSDPSGRTRQLSPPNYKISGSEVEIALPSGNIVTHWSGVPASDKVPAR